MLNTVALVVFQLLDTSSDLFLALNGCSLRGFFTLRTAVLLIPAKLRCARMGCKSLQIQQTGQIKCFHVGWLSACCALIYIRMYYAEDEGGARRCARLIARLLESCCTVLLYSRATLEQVDFVSTRRLWRIFPKFGGSMAAVSRGGG